jgi:hypothetical protein
MSARSDYTFTLDIYRNAEKDVSKGKIRKDKPDTDHLKIKNSVRLESRRCVNTRDLIPNSRPEQAGK